MSRIVEVYRRWPTHEDCIEYLEKVRWGGSPTCPYCGAAKIARHREGTRGDRWQCWACHKSFSVTVGTIFRNTRVDLQRWFLLLSLMLGAKNGLSAMQAARDLKMRRPTVWSMMCRIRNGLKYDGKLLAGIAEMDEVYVWRRLRKYNRREDDPPGGQGVASKPQVVGNDGSLDEFARWLAHATATLGIGKGKWERSLGERAVSGGREAKLFRAVILQALLDATAPDPELPPRPSFYLPRREHYRWQKQQRIVHASHRVRFRAREWLLFDDRDFELICHLADVEWECIRQMARALVDKSGKLWWLHMLEFAIAESMREAAEDARAGQAPDGGGTPAP